MPTQTIVVDANIRQFYFDRAAVFNSMSKRAWAALFRFAASIALTAKRSQRKRKKPSEPGTPPSAHEPRPYLRERIRFAYKPAEHTLIVGAEAINSVRIQGKSGTSAPARGAIPNTHEFGGYLWIDEYAWKGSIAGAQSRLVNARAARANMAAGSGRSMSYRSEARQLHAAIQYSYSIWKPAFMARYIPQAKQFLLTFRRRRAKYPARPFMSPALKKMLPRLPSMWNQSGSAEYNGVGAGAA